MLRVSSCVSGCLSAGAKTTHTTYRKLQFHLGQHSPVLHPDSAPASLWGRNPHTSFLSLLSHFPVVCHIFSFSLFLLMFFLAFSFSHLLTNSCRSSQAFFVGVSTYDAGTNTHSHKQITHSIQVFLVLIYR